MENPKIVYPIQQGCYYSKHFNIICEKVTGPIGKLPATYSLSVINPEGRLIDRVDGLLFEEIYSRKESLKFVHLLKI
jgi:hypothetical protein